MMATRHQEMAAPLRVLLKLDTHAQVEVLRQRTPARRYVEMGKGWDRLAVMMEIQHLGTDAVQLA